MDLVNNFFVRNMTRNVGVLTPQLFLFQTTMYQKKKREKLRNLNFLLDFTIRERYVVVAEDVMPMNLFLYKIKAPMRI